VAFGNANDGLGPDAGRAGNNDSTIKLETSFGRAQWNIGQERRPSLKGSPTRGITAITGR
jgi:hypothetical protein